MLEPVKFVEISNKNPDDKTRKSVGKWNGIKSTNGFSVILWPLLVMRCVGTRQ